MNKFVVGFALVAAVAAIQLCAASPILESTKMKQRRRDSMAILTKNKPEAGKDSGGGDENGDQIQDVRKSEKLLEKAANDEELDRKEFADKKSDLRESDDKKSEVEEVADKKTEVEEVADKKSDDKETALGKDGESGDKETALGKDGEAKCTPEILEKLETSLLPKPVEIVQPLLFRTSPDKKSDAMANARDLDERTLAKILKNIGEEGKIRTPTLVDSGRPVGNPQQSEFQTQDTEYAEVAANPLMMMVPVIQPPAFRVVEAAPWISENPYRAKRSPVTANSVFYEIPLQSYNGEI